MERSFGVQIAASPETVWPYLTTGEGLATWFVTAAEVTPGVGGKVVVDWGQDEKAFATIEIWEPPTRLKSAYDNDYGGHEEWILTQADGVTTVTLTMDIPGETPWLDDDLSRGWTLFLANLRFAVEGGHLGRTSELRLVPLAGSRELAWTRMTVAIGLPPQAPAGREVFVKDAGPAQVLVCIPDHSVLLGFGSQATLLLDFEGEPATLYGLASTYGPDSPALLELRQKLAGITDRAGAAVTT